MKSFDPNPIGVGWGRFQGLTALMVMGNHGQHRSRGMEQPAPPGRPSNPKEEADGFDLYLLQHHPHQSYALR